MSDSFVVGVLAMLFAARLLYAAATTPHAQEFWRRPFGPDVPRRDITFDMAGGVLLPVFCLLADPIVFKNTLLGSPLLGQYALLAYLTIGTAMLALATWLLCGKPAALLAGFLTAAALLAFVLGVLLLPLSMIGLFMAGIGILGLSPFVTALVFWRNARQAWARARDDGASAAWMVALVATCGFLVAGSGPLLTHVYVEQQVTQATELAMSPDPAEAAQGIDRLRRWHSIIDADRFVWVYAAEKDADRKERLAAAYKTLTGEDVAHRLDVLRD